MKRETDILVIGGGAIGICTAHYLLQQGRQVAVVNHATSFFRFGEGSVARRRTSKKVF